MFRLYATSLFATVFSLGISSAQAATFVFDPNDMGTDEITTTGFAGFEEVDLNQDGHNDIQLGIGGFFNAGGFVQSLSDFFRFAGGPPPGTPQNIDGSFLAAYQEVYISSTNGVADLFASGGQVGPGTFGTDSTFEDMFDAPSDNAIPNVGDSGYLGFRIDIGEALYQPVDGFLPFDGFASTPDSFYGFLFVEHGSLRYGMAGYNNVAGQAALIPGGGPSTPVVPLPASAFLLAAGVAGLGVMRRRKSKA